MPDSIKVLPVSTTTQIADVARIAHEVWNEYYVPLIGQGRGIMCRAPVSGRCKAIDSAKNTPVTYGRSLGYDAIARRGRRGGSSASCTYCGTCNAARDDRLSSFREHGARGARDVLWLT